MLSLLVVMLAAASPLTLSEALEQARENDLRREFVDDDNERAAWAAHRGLTRVLPTIDLGASITQNPVEVKVNDRVVTPLTVPQANAQARVSLFRGPDIPRAIAGYLEEGATRTGSRERLEALEHDVALRFLALAEANALKAARQKTLERAQTFVRLTELRVAGGEAIPLDVDNARAELSRLEAEVALVEGETRAAEIRLREVVAPFSEQPLDVTCEDCVPSLDVGNTLERDDLHEADARVDATFVREVGAWMTFLPTVDLIGNGRLQQPTLFNPNFVWWNAQLVLSWEVFSGGLSVVDGFDARRATHRAKREAEWLRRTAQNDAKTAKVALEGGHAVFTSAAARRAAAQSALSRAQTAFDEGEIDTLVVTEAGRNLEEAEVAWVSARYRVMRARLSARRAQGLPPLDDENTANGAPSVATASELDAAASVVGRSSSSYPLQADAAPARETP